MNNKGFMMAEVVVVSSVILVTLTALYVSYGKILSLYNQRVDYYDVTTLYELANIKETTDLGEYESKTLILNTTNKKIYYLHKNDLESLIVSNQTFKDYKNYLKDSTTFNSSYILIMENCSDKDNCKYAYLELIES